MAKRATKKPEAQGWRAVFNDFIKNFEIDSKETGRGVLKLYGTQEYLLDELASGMDEGIRFFVVLKGRQFGITTVTIPIDVLWEQIHEGMKGAIIANNPEVAANCRAMVKACWERLPVTHKLALEEGGDNAKLTRWSTKSELHYLAAGKTERNTGLGKSHGFSLIHGTEVGEWGSEEGLNSLIASLAQSNPNRLYIFESTAQGKNLFYRLWQKSLEHPERKCIFIPWYRHERYALDKRSKSFAHYIARAADEYELLMIDEVRKRGHELTPQQIAWHRKTRDDMTSLDAVKQNFPSWPEEAFIASAPTFFQVKALADNRNAAKRDAFKGFKFFLGDDATTMRLDVLDTLHGGIDLRIWSAPVPNGVYCVSIIAAADGVFGAESVVQVFRAFSDSIEQVAEFAGNIQPYQLAWVGAYLAGLYRNSYVNIEVDGIGRVVFREMKHLRELVELGVISCHPSKDPDGVFQSMIWYLYQRIDSASGSSRTFHWLGKGDPEKTKEIHLDFRDSWQTGRVIVHSVPLLDQMSNTISDGEYFGGDGEEPNERVYAACIALRTWMDSCRLFMVAQGATRARETERDVETKSTSLVQAIVENMLHRNSALINAEQERTRR